MNTTSLTKETIEQTPAGKELDMLVSLHITGVKLPSTYYARFDGASVAFPDRYPPYSTTGDGALLVLEKMRERNLFADIQHIPPNVFQVTFYQHSPTFAPGRFCEDITQADTLPEALLRAALLAILSTDKP